MELIAAQPPRMASAVRLAKGANGLVSARGANKQAAVSSTPHQMATKTAAVFALAQFISAYGVGNGFVLLYLVGIGRSVWGSFQGKWKNFESSPAQGLGIFLVAVLVVILFRFIRSAEDHWLPAFPQGGLPVSLVVATLPGLLWSWQRVLSFSSSQISGNAWLEITLLGIPFGDAEVQPAGPARDEGDLAGQNPLGEQRRHQAIIPPSTTSELPLT